MRRRPRTAAVLAAAAAFAGCVLPSRPVPPAASVASPAQALARLAQRDADTRTLTATFKLVLHRTDGTTEASRGAVVVARPDRLRLQIITFGVATAYDYTVDGERFRVRRPLEGIERIGRFDDPRTGDATALGDDLRPLFLHVARLDSAQVADGGDRYRVRAFERDGAREVEILKVDGRIARETLWRGEAQAVVIDYEDYRSVDGAEMPFLVRVAYPARGVSLAIEVQRYTRNQTVDPQVFRF